MGGATWGDFPCCAPAPAAGRAAELGAAEADQTAAEAFQEWNGSEVAPAKRLAPGEAYTDHDLEAAFIAGAIWAADRLTRVDVRAMLEGDPDQQRAMLGDPDRGRGQQ